MKRARKPSLPETSHFTDAQYMTAQQKRRVLGDWVRFFAGGMRSELHRSRGAAEPVFLATNLAAGARRVVKTYAERMQEEESFRDMKSHRYGFALRYPKLTQADRYERMLVVWALGMWLFFAQGAAAVSLGKHLGLSTATNTRRDLSLVSIGALLIRSAIGGVPTLMHIMADFVTHGRWG